MNRLLLLAAALALLASAAAADDDAFEFYKEEAEVVTASRRAEPAWRAPAAVDVVTAEDIKAYGFKEIWDALRYRAGLDVVAGRSLDGNRALVSARGFDSEFVTQMQVLVDGRSVYSPFLGGVYWQSLPVQLQDVERIEIVRGPNAALYGSNAALGVINIITKKPGPAAAESVSAWGGGRGAYGAAASGEAGGRAGGLRLSVETRAEDGHPREDGTSNGDDFLHLNKVNGRGRWSPDARTDVEFLAGGAWMTAGLPGLTPEAQARHVQNYESVKAARRLGGAGDAEVSLSRSELTIDNEPLFAGDVHVRTYQYDAQLLHRFAWLDDRVKSAWGADWRASGADSDQAFAGRPVQSNRLARGFTHHSVRLAEELTAVGGVSLEHSDTGGTQPDWQAALLAAPTEDQSLRLSYSNAATLPSLFEQRGLYRLSATQLFQADPSFGPQHLSSWELGWAGRFLDGALKPGLSLYYMCVRDFPLLEVAPGGPGVLLTPRNTDRAIARGAEASAEYALGPGRAAFANYAFERITNRAGTAATGQDVSRSTPRHKVNVGARAALPRGFSASVLAGYKDTYAINSDSRGTNAQIRSHVRVDARAAWSPAPGWELFVAGQELLQARFLEYPDGTASPRTVRAGVEGRFGL